MSWWITEIWPTISDRTPPCPIGRQQQDGGTVASSSLDLTKRRRNYYSSPFLHLRGCIMCTPPGLAPLFWLPWWLYFLGSTSSCWIVTAYRLLCLKLKTCGQKPTWRVFQPIVRVSAVLLGLLPSMGPRIVAWARAAFEQGALPSQQIVCFRPQRSWKAGRDQLLCMPMGSQGGDGKISCLDCS